MAEKIEQHIGKQFVGAYEVAKILHSWVAKPAVKWIGRKEKARAFCKHLATLTPHADYGFATALELIDHYQNA